MKLLAIDPGPIESAWVWLDESGGLQDFGIEENAGVEAAVKYRAGLSAYQNSKLVIEKVESYGMAVGASVFETVYWSGRFAALWDERSVYEVLRLGRKAVKLHLCGHSEAKDSNIRQALIDRYGGVGGKQAAVGTKKSPGPLYGVRKDLWAALAVGVTMQDTLQAEAA